MSFFEWKRSRWLELQGQKESVLDLCELAYMDGKEEGEKSHKYYVPGKREMTEFSFPSKEIKGVSWRDILAERRKKED